VGTLQPDDIRAVVRAALAEDVGDGDVTTLSTVPETATGSAVMVARERLVVAGLPVAVAVFSEISPGLKIADLAEEGESVPAGRGLLRLNGSARAMLTAERVALNFVQHLSGIATLTRQFVDAVRGTGARILDTRKTTPGLRRLEKYAVTCGGGHNHRFGLFDLVLIKDNHLAALQAEEPDAFAAAVARARAQCPGLRVEVEADTLEQVDGALAAGADIILLDNMTLEQLRQGVRKARGRALTEASGGVNLRTVRPIAETGVDFISVGALTHSARAVDIALDFEKGKSDRERP
jgi:nicotinate-nucleotide pyrophosphorylase (carboxylating)